MRNPTSEERDKFALCRARTKSGKPCRMFAGQGTDHVGVGCCFRHGGRTPSHRKAATAVAIEQRLHQLAEPLPEEAAQPHAVLRRLLTHAGGRLDFLDQAVASGETSGAVLRMYREERQFLANLAKLASEVNVEQVEANIKQAQVTLMANMIKEAGELVGFSGADLEALGVALRILAARQLGDTSREEAETARLDTLREKLIAADEERVRREAERRAGLIPAAEIGRGEDTAWLEGQPSTP